MNPFLVIAFIASMCLSMFGILLGYLTSDRSKSADCGIMAVLGFVLSIVFGIACGMQWENVNHPKPEKQQIEQKQ